MKTSLKIARISCLLLALLLAATLVSCNGSVYTINNKTVMTIDGYKVSYDEYRYFYVTMMQTMMDEGVTEFDEQALERLRSETLRLLCEMYAVVSLTDKYGVGLTKYDRELIGDEIDYMIDEQGGLAEYKKLLADENMSGQVFFDQYAYAYFLDPNLREILFTGVDHIIKMDAESIKEDVMQNFYRYTEIVLTYDQTVGSLTNYNKIISAYDELQNGGNFYEVANKYSEELMKLDVGVYSTAGEKVPEIENAALALEIGEYSGIIMTEKGYHILLRLNLDESFVNDNLESLSIPSATRRYHEYITDYATTLTVTYKKYYDTLTHEILIG